MQVVKDPLGTKGARLTTDITLPSRYLVLCRGFARWRIPTYRKRNGTRTSEKVVADYCDEQGGFIIRTAAEGVRRGSGLGCCLPEARLDKSHGA